MDSSLRLASRSPAVSRHRVMLLAVRASASPSARQPGSTAARVDATLDSKLSGLPWSLAPMASCSCRRASMVWPSSASTCCSTPSSSRVTGRAAGGLEGVTSRLTISPPRGSSALSAAASSAWTPSSELATPTPVASSHAGRYSFQALAAADSSTAWKAVLTRAVATGGSPLASATPLIAEATSWYCRYNAWPRAFACRRCSRSASRRPARCWAAAPASWLRPMACSRACTKAGGERKSKRDSAPPSASSMCAASSRWPADSRLASVLETVLRSTTATVALPCCATSRLSFTAASKASSLSAPSGDWAT
mmetsp:Transcript_97252/g.270621  ORF Transcript_97252/g.270621 Transcript_97252/m.270621 type:complete len:309 (+) Transcript_97252:671-1597(+)